MVRTFVLAWGLTLLAACGHTSAGRLTVAVNDLSTETNVTFFRGTERVQLTTVPAGQGASHVFDGPVGTRVCVQLQQGSTTTGFRGEISTTTPSALIILERNGAFVD